MLIFGTSWDAPICDGQTPVPPPVGVPCDTCDVGILPTDRGVLIPTWRANLDITVSGALVMDGVVVVPIHRECHLAEVVGHLVGVCRCTGYDPHWRTTGLEVARRIDLDSPRPAITRTAPGGAATGPHAERQR